MISAREGPGGACQASMRPVGAVVAVKEGRGGVLEREEGWVKERRVRETGTEEAGRPVREERTWVVIGARGGGVGGAVVMVLGGREASLVLVLGRMAEVVLDMVGGGGGGGGGRARDWWAMMVGRGEERGGEERKEEDWCLLGPEGKRARWRG